MNDVTERVRRVEVRLERLLASGWRNAGTEAADLADEAAVLGELGLAALGERLQRVSAAESGAAALPAIALALAACRQLRARLAADNLTAADWAPLAPPRRAERTPARLVPVGRMAVGQEEAWACVRLRGQWADAFYLVDPPAASEETPERGAPPWLGGVLEGTLAWEARYPLGASGAVERCRLVGGKVAEPSDAERHVLAALRQAAGKPGKDGQTVLGGAGGLRLRHLERAEAQAYAWPDPSAAGAFSSVRDEKVWALAWVEGAAIRPLVLLSPRWFLQPPALVHLVPGLPRTPIG